jgi:hypothetical protein
MLAEITCRETVVSGVFFAPRESDLLFGFFKQPKTAVSITAIYRGLELSRFQAV